MKKNLISKYGYSYKGVILDPVSKCVPDQSLSVEDILRRFTQGTLLAADIERSHMYGDDIDPNENEDNMDPLYDPEVDLVDIHDAALSCKDIQDRVKKELKQRKRAKNDKAVEATQSDEQDKGSEASP